MARMYWVWTRDFGPGLCSVEVPLAVCLRELQLDEAQPLANKGNVSGEDLAPDGVVLEIQPLEGEGIAAGFYRLAERRGDPVIQKLLRRL